MSRNANDGAKKARSILREHYSRGEPEGAVEALITDLREYCKRQGLSFDHLARRTGTSDTHRWSGGMPGLNTQEISRTNAVAGEAPMRGLLP